MRAAATRRRSGIWGWALAGLSLLVPFEAGCGSSAPATRSAEAAEPPPDVFDVRVPYTATLLHLLDAASRGSGLDPAYAAWLDEPPEHTPRWLQKLQQARIRWRRRWYHRPRDRTSSPLRWCGYESESVAQAIDCASRGVPDGDAELVQRAILELDRVLQPWWGDIGYHLRAQAFHLRLELGRPWARRLTAKVRDFVGLRRAPHFTVVLVAQAPGSSIVGRRDGHHLVIAAHPSQDDELPLTAVFHEYTHLLLDRSEHAAAVEHALTLHGERGTIAGNYWNEVVATLFGSYARHRIDSGHGNDELYADPLIEALTRALSRHWESRPRGQLGEDFAGQMVELLDEVRPQTGFRIQHLVFRTVAFAETWEALRTLRSSLPFHRFWGLQGIPQRLGRPDETPPSASTLVMTTYATLRSRPQLLSDAGLGPRALQHIDGSGSYLYHGRDATDRPVFLVLAPDEPTLLEQAARFERIAAVPLPERGWHALGRRPFAPSKATHRKPSPAE